MSSVEATLAELRELIRSHEACIEKRRRAIAGGALRVRVAALDCELEEINSSIQRLRARKGIAFPRRARPVELKTAV